MLVNIFSAKCIGIDAVRVTVEMKVDIGVGIHLVGLADTAVKESLLRTVTALQSIGYRIPGKKIVINLAPADLHKSGSGYDLPIALGILAASEQEVLPELGKYLILGELGLDGGVRDIQGALSAADLARKEGMKGCIFPEGSARECCELDDIPVYGIKDLQDAVTILGGLSNCSHLLCRKTSAAGQDAPGSGYMDFEDIIGQEAAKRCAEIAAAGGHNLILIGPPGTGKSSIAKAVAGILPPMSREEAITTTKIWSVSGALGQREGFMRQRPFRAPHYSASLPAIIGGGNGDNIFPGEVSLANAGVLFLDEFPQMPRSVAEALRAPLEDRKVTISRLKSKVEYPASFMLLAAANPCPCGYWGDGDRCTCTPTQRAGYLARFSGPMMDRIDLQCVVGRIDSGSIGTCRKGEASATIAARVLRARKVQERRFAKEDITTNAEMDNKMIERFCPLHEEAALMLRRLVEKMQYSMRAYFRIIRVARTIADLEECPDIEVRHILEASSYRFLDRQESMY